MSVEGRDILLDVTRLISRSWTGRQSTGIDRVCYAYLRHYRGRALAVVQHRGVVRVLGPSQSQRLFDLLLAPTRGFRSRLVTFASRALAVPVSATRLAGMTYLNCGHTDFDLEQHHQWAIRHRIRTIYFVHDLIPILHPDLTRPRAVRRHDGRVRKALGHADGIIVSSHSVAADLSGFAERENLAVPPVIVAPIAGERLVGAPRAADYVEPFFLCVGTIEPRKNHRLLLQVWTDLVRRAEAPAPRLVIVGQRGPLTGNILEPLRQDRALAACVELHPRCTDAQLAAFMAGARALLMPSLAEGFGLPLVEALQIGTPVIASDIGIFRETGQGLPLLLDPTDQGAWSEAVMALTNGIPTSPDEALSFVAPSWGAHFATVDRWMASRSLKSATACESSLAA